MKKYLHTTDNATRDLVEEYRTFLQLEKSLSHNTIVAYLRDLKKLLMYLQEAHVEMQTVGLAHLRDFLIEVNHSGIQRRSQARVVSSIKSFFGFMLYKNKIEKDPTELLETPKVEVKLPTVLSVKEIEKIIDMIDLSQPIGHRNRTMIEMLYGSGLRVSELIDVRLSHIHIEEKYMLIEGKGNKQRLVPLSDASIEQMLFWNEYRQHMNIKKGHEDYLFLNRRGEKLSRAMVFQVVKMLTAMAGIRKKISPHTFRHSFATHLHENGANLRAIQQLLGHESITTTELYTHIDIKHLKKTIETYHPINKKR